MDFSGWDIMEWEWWRLVLIVALGVSLAKVAHQASRRVLRVRDRELSWAFLAFAFLLLFSVAAQWAFGAGG